MGKISEASKSKLYKQSFDAKDGAIYSVDKVVLSYRLAWAKDKDLGQSALDEIAGFGAMQCSSWQSHKMGSFRTQVTITCTNLESFWLGVGLNAGGKVDNKLARLEFNQNKVDFQREFMSVYNLLFAAAKRVEIKRFDLAIDLPMQREAVQLVKDGRLFEEYRRSASNLTQYLGARNADGRVKVYNKTIEKELTEPVTRLEITCGGDAFTDDGALVRVFPRLFVQRPAAAGADNLNDTDLFILRTLLQEPARVKELGRRKRKQFETLLSVAWGELEIDWAGVAWIRGKLSEYLQLLPCECPPAWNDFITMCDVANSYN